MGGAVLPGGAENGPLLESGGCKKDKCWWKFEEGSTCDQAEDFVH